MQYRNAHVPIRIDWVTVLKFAGLSNVRLDRPKTTGYDDMLTVGVEQRGIKSHLEWR